MIVLVLIALAAFVAHPFSGPADPIDTAFQPKPEWNFLFLYQAIKAFQGPWEPAGTIGIPTVPIVLLVGLPFFDKNRERNPLKRPVAMSIASILALGVITLTFTGYYSHPNAQANVGKKVEAGVAANTGVAPVKFSDNDPAGSAQSAGTITVPPGVNAIQNPSQVGHAGPAADMIGKVGHGKKLFDANCTSCSRSRLSDCNAADEHCRIRQDSISDPTGDRQHHCLCHASQQCQQGTDRRCRDGAGDVFLRLSRIPFSAMVDPRYFPVCLNQEKKQDQRFPKIVVKGSVQAPDIPVRHLAPGPSRKIRHQHPFELDAREDSTNPVPFFCVDHSGLNSPPLAASFPRASSLPTGLAGRSPVLRDGFPVRSFGNAPLGL